MLREHGPPALRKREPGDWPRKRWPIYRSNRGVIMANHQVTLEQELQEIRARHEARREYNRQRNQAYRARMAPTPENPHDTARDRPMDEPYAR